MKNLLLIITVGITVWSCSKDDDLNDGVLVLYNQTYCFDSWGYPDTDKELADVIIEYLDDLDIELYNVKIDTNGTPQLCNACFCLSGKRIIGRISVNDLDAIKEYGFREFE
ncbi:hypothetical protein [Gelidibacter mesophilus]|uniref:hypothetical protein n=1 Tax=Gelidibacter mesophilus TaxID=169050 RepID=UPI0004179C2D|nr:hypothetical protein [Gelidibacter mesophilus]